MPREEPAKSGQPNGSGPVKESGPRFGEWVQTTQGIISIISTVAALIGGGASAAFAFYHDSSHSSSSQFPAADVTTSATTSAPATPSQNDFNNPANLAQITEALPPVGVLGANTTVTYQTSLANLTETCGGLMPTGDQLTSSEDITNTLTGQYLQIAVIEWDNATDAASLIANDHSLIDPAGSCSLNAAGNSYQWNGDYPGVVPSDCAGGQYFATQITDETDNKSGFQVTAQCGRYVIAIVLSANIGQSPTQQATDDYLDTTVERLLQAIR